MGASRGQIYTESRISVWRADVGSTDQCRRLPFRRARTSRRLSYTTLNFGTTDTFLTGIRGNTIVGDYVVPGTTDTGGLLYDITTGTFTAFPVATDSGVNYPGAISSSPYGPSFGSQYGILRTVGSYRPPTPLLTI